MTRKLALVIKSFLCTQPKETQLHVWLHDGDTEEALRDDYTLPIRKFSSRVIVKPFNIYAHVIYSGSIWNISDVESLTNDVTAYPIV